MFDKYSKVDQYLTHPKYACHKIALQLLAICDCKVPYLVMAVLIGEDPIHIASGHKSKTALTDMADLGIITCDEGYDARGLRDSDLFFFIPTSRVVYIQDPRIRDQILQPMTAEQKLHVLLRAAENWLALAGLGIKYEINPWCFDVLLPEAIHAGIDEIFEYYDASRHLTEFEGERLQLKLSAIAEEVFSGYTADQLELMETDISYYGCSKEFSSDDAALRAIKVLRYDPIFAFRYCWRLYIDKLECNTPLPFIAMQTSAGCYFGLPEGPVDEDDEPGIVSFFEAKRGAEVPEIGESFADSEYISGTGLCAVLAYPPHERIKLATWYATTLFLTPTPPTANALIIEEGAKTLYFDSASGDELPFKNIKELVLPDSVRKLLGSAQHMGVEEVYIPDSCEVISAVFAYSTVQSLSVPSGMELKEAAFKGCSKLTNIEFRVIGNAATETTIGERAFANCDRLINLDLPPRTVIGSRAFEGCVSLARVSAPSPLIESADVFYGCRCELTLDFDYVQAPENYIYTNGSLDEALAAYFALRAEDHLERFFCAPRHILPSASIQSDDPRLKNRRVKFCSCEYCQPIPGDKLDGYVTARVGKAIVMAHRHGCTHLPQSNPPMFGESIALRWVKDAAPVSTEIVVGVPCVEAIEGVLKLIAHSGLEMSGLGIRDIVEGETETMVTLAIMVPRAEILDDVIFEIGNLDEVSYAMRCFEFKNLADEPVCEEEDELDW